MHDAIGLEAMGVPTAVIVLEGFQQLANSTRKLLGRGDLALVVVPGTLASPAVARAMADDALPQIVQRLTVV